MHHTVNFPSSAAGGQSFPHPEKHQEKNDYVTLALRSNRGGGREREGRVRGGGNPQYLTPLIPHSLWLRPRNNLLISSPSKLTQSPDISPPSPESNRPWLAYENPNHRKLLLMRCWHVWAPNNFRMTGECVEGFFFSAPTWFEVAVRSHSVWMWFWKLMRQSRLLSSRRQRGQPNPRWKNTTMLVLYSYRGHGQLIHPYIALEP